VANSQAGEAISCACGQTVDVPTLRELRTLPTADASAPGTRPAWSVARGALFVAGALMIASAALAVWQIAPRRARLEVSQPTFAELEFDVQTLSPLQAWDAWEHFRAQKLEYRATPKFIEERAKYRELSYYLYAAVAAGAIGLLLMAASLVWPWKR
jgi:hypothetical protein